MTFSGKTQWLRGAILAGSLTAMTAFGATQAATRASIPFEFQMAGKMMPAGKYEFRQDGSQGTMIVTGPAGRTVVVALPAESRNAFQPELEFDRTGSGFRLKRVWQTAVPVTGDGFSTKSASVSVTGSSGAVD